MKDQFKAILQEAMHIKADMFDDDVILTQIEQCVKAIVAAFRHGNKVYFCGNGGSAADAQHLAAEFSGRFYLDRQPLPAEALHCNTSYLTAVANDYGYEHIYSRLIEALGQPGDVLIALTTSGKSSNVLSAIDAANNIGVYTVALTGKDGLAYNSDAADMIIKIPSTNTPRIQEAQMILGHIICEMVEKEMFG